MHSLEGIKFKFVNWNIRLMESVVVVVVSQLLSRVWLFVTQCTVAHQASLSFPSPGACSNSCALSRWCHPTISSSVSLLLLLPSIFPSIRGFSNELALRLWWPEYWSFSFSISPSSEDSGLISLRMDWFDLLAVQGSQLANPFSMKDATVYSSENMRRMSTCLQAFRSWIQCL